MKTQKTSALLLVLIIVLLAGCKVEEPDEKTRPDRGKIIATRKIIEEEVDGVKTQYFEGEVCFCDTSTKQLDPKKKKKFKVKKNEVPSWFKMKCDDTGDWVIYRTDTIETHVRIIGYIKNEYWNSCED